MRLPALLGGEIHIIQRLEQGAFFGFLADQLRAGVAQGLLETLQGAEAVFLGEVADFNGGHYWFTTKALRKAKGIMVSGFI